jgi:hypothetical protein
MPKVANVREKTPTIELEGKTYTLRYDFNAWADMEEQYGSMEAAMDALTSAQDLKGKPATIIRFFLWVGLHQDLPELTLQDVGQLLSPGNMAKILEGIMEAVNQSTTGNETKGE